MNHPIRDYLPYVGHAMMGAGYLLEHLNTFRPPLPSGVVLIGHVFVLNDKNLFNNTQGPWLSRCDGGGGCVEDSCGTPPGLRSHNQSPTKGSNY
ncbi:hypothetical protein JYU34_009284 [Plutella xylostella]|uniref:Uncharacterized protein n=1 Tax=Plutella xylostella TaxID=51655 RepID=A0ABQ7QJ95_PLUXY|nr:hypothetical protein JYU34_009284 [Plutella xylostella]